MILPILNYRNNYYERRGQSKVASAPSFGAAVNNAYKKINVNSADYIEYVYKISRKICNKPIEINVESGRLDDIVKSREPYIFIMNHTFFQKNDLDATEFFNTLLYREYLYNGFADSCPRSKILANANILKRKKDKGEKAKWLGITPINLRDKKNNNAVVLRNITRDFIADKINLFIFPEGSLASLVFLPLKYKFQPGVSTIIRKALEEKEKVNVVPLGFAHSEKGSAIHIGNTVSFFKRDGKYIVSKGNLESQFFDKDLAKMYKSQEMTITDEGKEINYKNVVPYISGILVKNLECTVKEARNDLKNSSSEVLKI